MRRLALAALLAASALTGCGGSSETAPGGVQADNAVAAYKKIAAAWMTSDARTACSAMSTSYQHKVQAELEIFDSTCSLAVAEIHKQLVGKKAIKDLSVQKSDGPDGVESVLVRASGDDESARKRFDLKEEGGRWTVVDDRVIDATGPQGPVDAYRTLARAESPEILWSEGKGDHANIWEISGNGSGTYTLTKIRMSNKSGKWKVVTTETVGTAPPATKIDDSVSS